MNIKEYSSNSLSFIGDAVYTLHVREYFINNRKEPPAGDSNRQMIERQKTFPAKGIDLIME